MGHFANVIVPLLAGCAKTLAGMELTHQIGFSGIGLSQRGPHQDRFVHLDTKPRKALWSY